MEILKTNSSLRPTVKTYRAGKESGSLNELLGKAEWRRDYEVLPQKKQKAGGTTGISSTFHGLTPELIIAGKQSGQDRIVIEVKKYSNPESFDHPDGNQFANYFFHLFATTDVKSPDDHLLGKKIHASNPFVHYVSVRQRVSEMIESRILYSDRSLSLGDQSRPET